MSTLMEVWEAGRCEGARDDYEHWLTPAEQPDGLLYLVWWAGYCRGCHDYEDGTLRGDARAAAALHAVEPAPGRRPHGLLPPGGSAASGARRVWSGWCGAGAKVMRWGGLQQRAFDNGRRQA